MKNEHVEAVTAELDAAGVAYELAHGGKHLHINWRHECQPRTFVVPVTPSDRRGWLNARSDVRRILKTDGLIGGEVAEYPRTFLKSQAVFVSSLDMARHFEKAHKDVLRAIDRVFEDIGDPAFTERNFAPSTYVDGSGRSLRCFDMTRDGFSFVAMSFTGAAAAKWKVSYLAAFNAMEVELIRLASEASAPAVLIQQVQRLEADLNALIDINLEKTAPKIKKPPFVRPSVLRRMRRAA